MVDDDSGWDLTVAAIDSGSATLKSLVTRTASCVVPSISNPGKEGRVARDAIPEVLDLVSGARRPWCSAPSGVVIERPGV